MKMIGRRSVASVMRWILGFVNVFVSFAVVVTGLSFVISLIMPDAAAGFLDGLARVTRDSGENGIMISQRVVYLASFVATLSTWWVLKRLRCIFLAVNHGDAFDPGNVGRLQGIGLGLIGVQVSAAILAFTVPEGVPGDADYGLNLGAWLGILIVFMLAEVFRQGSTMRDDQQMTV